MIPLDREQRRLHKRYKVELTNLVNKYFDSTIGKDAKQIKSLYLVYEMTWRKIVQIANKNKPILLDEDAFEKIVSETVGSKEKISRYKVDERMKKELSKISKVIDDMPWWKRWWFAGYDFFGRKEPIFVLPLKKNETI